MGEVEIYHHSRGSGVRTISLKYVVDWNRWVGFIHFQIPLHRYRGSDDVLSPTPTFVLRSTRGAESLYRYRGYYNFIHAYSFTHNC